MQRCHNRHIEARQEFDDVSSRLATEDSILMLQANDLEFLFVEIFGRTNIVVSYLVMDLKADNRRIFVFAAWIGHGHDGTITSG